MPNNILKIGAAAIAFSALVPVGMADACIGGPQGTKGMPMTDGMITNCGGEVVEAGDDMYIFRPSPDIDTHDAFYPGYNPATSAPEDDDDESDTNEQPQMIYLDENM